MNKQDVIKAAQTLKAYCGSFGADCTGCAFDVPGSMCAVGYDPPEFWELPAPEEYQEED